jgi:hypothetical protein
MPETIHQTVTVSVEEIIDNNMEGFLDLLDALVSAGTEYANPLSDISWEVVGLGAEPNTIEVSVIARRETDT